MKHLATLMLSMLAITSLAQNCVTSDMGLDAGLSGWWADADRASDGSIVGVLTDPYGLDDVVAVKTNASGQLIWQRYLATTNTDRSEERRVGKECCR